MTMSTFPVLAYHGCDAAIADDIINGRRRIDASRNEYDWLGAGIYFWIGSYNRALDWAKWKQGRGEVEIQVSSAPLSILAIVSTSRITEWLLNWRGAIWISRPSLVC